MIKSFSQKEKKKKKEKVGESVKKKKDLKN